MTTDRFRSEEMVAVEKWKPIPGYEGIYEASNLGRIRTAPGKTTESARHGTRHWSVRVLKTKRQSPPKRTDERVTLWKDKTPHSHLVSRLVASAWLRPPQGKETVNHINGNYHDNRPENLEWVSLAENVRLGFDMGLFASFQKGVLLVDENGYEMEFRSYSQAGQHIGRTSGYVSNVLKHGRSHARDKSGNLYLVVPIEQPERR